MAVGHRIVGTGRTALYQFRFRFFDFALINPANPIIRPILATTTDIDYLEWHRTPLRNPNPQDAELVTWICRDNPEYLDLTATIVRASWVS